MHGWGRQSVLGRRESGEDLERVGKRAGMARGLGRSYGDASLPAGPEVPVLDTTRADRILGFDRETGWLRAEAGLSIAELNRLYWDEGYFVPVTPGTQFVTLGGAVAADVHGKNQHAAGNIGDHVGSMRVRVADGRVLDIGPEREPELFRATIGGMGLTAQILEVETRLERVPSKTIFQYSRRIGDIDEFQDALTEAAPDWPYSMGWIDCLKGGASLGRGTMMCGRYAEPHEVPAKRAMPRYKPTLRADWPQWILNPLSIRAFNELKYWSHLPKEAEGFVDAESFFYPLDAIRHWYRLYGKPGFTQYQCVLPRSSGRGSARRVLEALSRLGGASFLCVIKDFGRDSLGTLSFPEPGITLALDLPIRSGTQALVDALNRVVLDEGGRIYLAKDSFTREADFRAMDPRVEAFNAIRDEWDPERRFKSALSVRLLGDSR